MLDSYRHQGLRKKLVDELRMKGIEDEQVLEVIGRIPRHCFIDSTFDAYAYQDKSFYIGEGQTISQPFTVAVQTVLLEVASGDKILEVGTGSGYQALTLDWLGADVFSVERQKKLYLKTKQLLTKFKSTVKIFYGDGYLGLPVYAPFDKIIVTCGAPIIPSALIEQLKIGGIMIVPLGEKKQIMTKVIKISDKDIKVTEHGDFNFVPMLSEKVR